MSAAVNALEFSLPSTEFQHQALMITVSMIITNLFRHKARFLVFLRILPILLNLRTPYMVLTPL